MRMDLIDALRVRCAAAIPHRSSIETLRDNPQNLRRYPNVPAADDHSDLAVDARQQAFEDSEDR